MRRIELLTEPRSTAGHNTEPMAPTDPPDLARHGIERIRADNPGPLTLSGTNSWVLGRDPAYVIDPGPALAAHLDAVAAAVRERGGLGAIVLTHGHHDHSDGVAGLLERFPGSPPPPSELGDGERVGPLTAIATPGHAPDHVAFVAGRACFTGDAVLGEGSVFIAPDPGALSGYLASLRRLRELELDVLCPGHGPPVWEPRAKLDEYIDHRLERERRLVAALEGGERSVEALLDAAWSDVPAQLRPAAAITLAAHLDKLAEEGRLPGDVERPRTGAV